MGFTNKELNLLIHCVRGDRHVTKRSDDKFVLLEQLENKLNNEKHTENNSLQTLQDIISQKTIELINSENKSNAHSAQLRRDIELAIKSINAIK